MLLGTLRIAESHRERLHTHLNVGASWLLDNTVLVKRLKRPKLVEIV